MSAITQFVALGHKKSFGWALSTSSISIKNCATLNRMNHDNCVRSICALSEYRLKYCESRGRKPPWRRHPRKSITATLTLRSRGARCEERRAGHSYGTVTLGERRKRERVRPTKAADHGDSWEEVKVRFTMNSAPHQHRRSTVFRLWSNSDEDDVDIEKKIWLQLL